jgi:alkanesulfonate monooxygenase SsuD/methylene tetrahydromethanopterin reductase-like flavin-dependent oxidoreductase (luciferase family)
MTDHLRPFGGIGGPATPLLEPWVTLGAIAEATSRIQLLTLVTNASLRHAALLAKMAVALDGASDGRMVLGLGAGGYRPEYDSFGLPYPPGAQGAALVGEVVEIVRSLWRAEETTRTWSQHRLERATIAPRPSRTPRVLIAGSSPAILDVAARHADLCNVLMPSPDGLSVLLPDLRERMRSLDRAPGAIEVTVLDRVIIAPTAEQTDAKWQAAGAPQRNGHRGVVGTPADAVRCLQAYRTAGLDTLMASFAESDAESRELFARKVMPALAG